MITVQKTDFLTAIKAVKTATAKAQLQPVLQTIHLKTDNNTLILTSTDLQNSAKAIIEANVKEQVNICINAERLEGIISRLDEIIEIETEKSTAIFRSGKTCFKCLFIEGSEFPEIKFELKGKKILLPYNEFISGIQKTCFATQDSGHNIISGVCFKFDTNKYEMAATDGNRLCKVNFENIHVGEGEYVIPKIALISVAKIIKDNVEIYFDNEIVTFVANNFIYSTRLFNGKFPPYEQIIPKKFNKTVYIDKAEFIKALDKVSIMADMRTYLLKMTFAKNTLELLTHCSDGDAKDTLEIDYEIEDFVIVFNLGYVLEGIKAMTSDVIEMNFNSATTAVLFDGDYNYVVMPINNTNW